MENTEYSVLIGEILQKVALLMTADNANAQEMVQHSAKFIAVLDRQKRKIARETKIEGTKAVNQTAKPKDTK